MPRRGKHSGQAQWRMGVSRYTRMPVATFFENLELGSGIDEIIEQYDVTREQIQAVLEFAGRSLDAPPVAAGAVDAHPV
jgi:uncharacterized protein (DUF433 family)